MCLKEELQPPVQKRPKLSNESEDTCGQLSVPTLLETIGSLKEVILFVDLSEWSESSLEHKSLEKEFFFTLQACLRATFPIVLASSSSHGGMTAPKYVQSLRTHVTPWMWKPFTLEETEKFKNKLHYKCGTVTTQQLFNITCGNPRFLLQCSHLTTLNIMSSEISEMVEHLVGKLLEYKKSSTDNGDILGLSYPDVNHKIFIMVRRRYQGELPPPVHRFFFFSITLYIP